MRIQSVTDERMINCSVILFSESRRQNTRNNITQIYQECFAYRFFDSSQFPEISAFVGQLSRYEHILMHSHSVAYMSRNSKGRMHASETRSSFHWAANIFVNFPEMYNNQSIFPEKENMGSMKALLLTFRPKATLSPSINTSTVLSYSNCHN